MSNPDGKLVIKVGSNREFAEWKKVEVNSNEEFGVENEHFKGGIKVFVQNYNGATRNAERLNGKKRLFSFVIRGKFTKPLSGEDVVFAAEFEKPLKIPIGLDIATRFAKFIDPCLDVNLKSVPPIMISPLLCAMNSISKRTNEEQSLDEENLIADCKPHKRRSLFQSAAERKKFVFSPEFEYQFAFFNPYVDWNTFKFDMGIKINAVHYLNRQPARFIAREKGVCDILFGIEVDLLSPT